MSTNENIEYLRTYVRGTYDIQKLRVAIGNRITGNFKAKLGFKNIDNMSEQQLEKENKNILEELRKAYYRITDGVVNEGNSFLNGAKPIKAKAFIGNEIISSFAEMALVKTYVSLLENEEAQFNQLKDLLKGIPVYDNFLCNIEGLGHQMAAVLISEIDFTRCQYPSSIWKYAGLDCITVGVYINSAGQRKIIPAEEIELWFENHGQNGEFDMLAEGKYPVTLETVGRSKKAESLVNRKYIGRDGVEKTKLSITFNPFLKTKLIGVLATSFLRGGGIIVDGVKMGKERLIEYAIQNGFDIKEAKKTIKTSAAIEDESELDVKELAVEYLRSNGFDVEIVRTKYGKYYYDYRNRLNNSPHHKEKSKKHIHNMALRFMIKRFLVDLYVAGRTAEGLPVAEEYGVAKLGLIHGQACAAKERKQA